MGCSKQCWWKCRKTTLTSRIFISLVAIGSFYKSCTETDLTILLYITFIEPFGVFPTDAVSFDFKQLMNNSMNKEFDPNNIYTMNVYTKSYIKSKLLIP
jgi:hypothetical protein